MILKRFPDKDRFMELCQTSNEVPVCREILADTETPVSMLEKFYRPDNPMFLLESVEGGERWARYSFLGVSAKSHIKVFQKTVEITAGEQSEILSHHGDPVAVLQSVTDRYTPCEMRELPRFWSGLTGYIAYEMVSFFENIPVSLPRDKPYAHFIIPDEMIIFDNIKQHMICVRICYLDDHSDHGRVFDEACRDLDRLMAKIDEPRPGKESNREPAPAGTTLKPETEPDVYKNGVETIKNHIVEGDIIQAVYSQTFSCPAPNDPVMLYRAQRYINPSPYMFFMNFKELTIAGSSPETMVRLENQKATLRPIAGTRKRGGSEQEDRKLADELLNDEKERAEHLMLVDLGRNDLGRVAETGTVQVTDMMFIERYSHVMHLVSNITCDMEPHLTAWDLLKATFPAGTLSGAPKIRAMEIIADLEKTSRGIYGGAAGYISFSGNMDLAITIRTASIEEGRMRVQAGAGIVADSDPQSELAECINKAKSVEKALQLALSGEKGGSPCR
ncbi:MAG TPA: anthranilate synthase component I [Desulfobacteraceae bacterium]|nr:anthranilate synthase component I [Desulfobacteraceae bacterium]